MPVQRISSGTKWEPVVGYSRAVAAGGLVFVSGCTSVAGAEFVHPGDAYAQAAQALRNVGEGLAGLGASFADVVQTRMYVTDIERWEEIGRAHGEVFGDVLPAATMVQVARLIDPRMLVEIEVIAFRPIADLPGSGGAEGGLGGGAAGPGKLPVTVGALLA